MDERKTAEAVENAKETKNEKAEKNYEEITLKFGKGCVGEEFTGKDGNQYKQILIPNQDKDDHRPWQTFVMKSNQVHDNQFGKGMWCKLPAEGSTTVQRNVVVGQDEQGKPVWDTEKTKVPNKELKKMVEAYKERSSMKEKISEKKAEIAEQKPAEKAAGKEKSMEAAI